MIRPLILVLLSIVVPLGSQLKWVVLAKPIDKPIIPCHFVFGDSLADNGNNNDQIAGFKADFYPYGMDYPRGSTGRFSNGRTTIDFIEEHLGFQESSPAYLYSEHANILRGVNYASGGSGLRDDTGFPGIRKSFSEQIDHHRTIVKRFHSLLGDEVALDLLGKCIYSITSGSNDFIANYFLPMSQTSLRFTVEQYATLLIKQYSHYLKFLYDEGARKIALFGLTQLGCTPFEIIANIGINGTGCVTDINNAAVIFNNKLVDAVDELNQDLVDAKITFINASSELIKLLGPIVTTATCCEVEDGALGCIPSGPTCTNRDKAVFFDAFHPTEGSSVVFAQIAFNARGPEDAYPYDISQLAYL